MADANGLPKSSDPLLPSSPTRNGTDDAHDGKTSSPPRTNGGGTLASHGAATAAQPLPQAAPSLRHAATSHRPDSASNGTTTSHNPSIASVLPLTDAAATAPDADPPAGFVQPSSYLRRPRAASRPMPPPAEKPPPTAVDREQLLGLRAIRAFLKARTSYDVLPLSFRLIVFDTALLVKNSLNILIQNGIASAPLWDSKTSTFAGLLTTSDYINVIQYYWQHPDALARIDQFRLDALRDIEKALGVVPLETASIHPLRPLYAACRRMLATRARRIPLVDVDDDTRRATIVNVMTQYRILKFVAVNVTETQLLRAPLRTLRVGTYEGVCTARMETPVIDVITQLVRRSISAVPILNSDGIVVNVFEAVDVITLIKGGVYDDLTLSVGEALQKRAPDFPGIFTCSLDDRLDSIFDTIRKSRVHRFVVVDDDKRLSGVLTLSDILHYILLEGEGDDEGNFA